MKDMKKKLLISSLALAMVTMSSSFVMHRIYGEDVEGEKEKVVQEEPKVEVPEEVKAFLTAEGNVTGRTNDDASDSNDINRVDLQKITDLMIDENLMDVAADKFKDFKNLTKLTFKGAATSSKVTTIGANAFKGTGIRSVVLPKNLSDIKEGAFADIPTLTTVNFTNSTTLSDIRRGAFENSGLTSVDLSPMNPAGTKGSLKVEEDAFKGSKSLATLTLSTRMTELKSGTFAATNLTSVEIVKGISKVDPYAFLGTPLTTLTVDSKNDVLTAEENVLYDKNKTSIGFYPEGKMQDTFTIPDTVITIRSKAFSSSPSLTKVLVGKGLMYIGESAFENTKKLTTLDLREAVALTTISEKAFEESGLNILIIGEKTGSLTNIEENAFHSEATEKQIVFRDEKGEAIVGDKLAPLVEKYAKFKENASGLWEFHTEPPTSAPTPTATLDYDNMRLADLVPSAVYTIDEKEYTADANGNVKLLKEWGGKEIAIVQKAASDHSASEAQSLSVANLATLTIDEMESLKKEGADVSVTAPEKEGYVFTTWTSTGVTAPTVNGKTIMFKMPSNDVKLTTNYTVFRTIKLEDFLYDGTNLVTVRLDYPMNEFESITYDGKSLVNNTDYVVAEGSTIITFTKPFLDNMKEDRKELKAMFATGEVTFSIKRSVPAAINPVVPASTSPVVEKTAAKSPNTGDNTNIYAMFITLLLSIGAIVFVKKGNSNTKR